MQARLFLLIGDAKEMRDAEAPPRSGVPNCPKVGLRYLLLHFPNHVLQQLAQ